MSQTWINIIQWPTNDYLVGRFSSMPFLYVSFTLCWVGQYGDVCLQTSGTLQASINFASCCAQSQGQPEVNDWYFLLPKVFLGLAHTLMYAHSLLDHKEQIRVFQILLMKRFPFQFCPSSCLPQLKSQPRQVRCCQQSAVY